MVAEVRKRKVCEMSHREGAPGKSYCLRSLPGLKIETCGTHPKCYSEICHATGRDATSRSGRPSLFLFYKLGHGPFQNH